MRNLKKILSLVLAMMMVLSLMVTASAATFADDEDIDYKEAVEVMSAIGVLNGVKNADGTYDFLPKDTLNRAAGAKIVAYIANGGNLDPQVMDTLENPFTDVSGWAVDSVKYCYNEGIINGIGGGLFDPKNSLDGYAFGKMMLEAAGYDWQSANGSNWKSKVLMTLKSNGLLTGIEDLVFSQPMTREQACQMAWNVMQKAPGAATAAPVYTVTVSGTTYEFATAAEAYFFAQGQTPAATVKVKDNSVSAGSLAASFGLTSSTTNDAYGRTTKTWTSSKIDTLNVVLADDAATYTFTVKAAATVGNAGDLVTAVNAALGLTGDAALTQTGAVEIVNGVTGFSNLGVGDTVEVYASSTGVVSKVIVIRETVGAASCAATAETTGTYKGLYKWTFGTNAFTYADKDAYTKDAYYIVVENGTTHAALDIKVPTVVSGAKITSADNAAIASATYVTINGDKVYKAGAYNHNVTTDSNTVVFNKAYDFILDSKGNVLFVTAAAAAVVEDPLETGYAYLLGAEKKVTTTAASSGGLLGDDVAYSWDIAAKAKLAMADGTTQVVDLTTEVTRNALGVVTALKLNGQTTTNAQIDNDPAIVNLMGSSNLFNGVTWVQYTVQKDGTYTLASVVTKDTDLTKNNATVNIDGVGDKTATSATTWTVYNYDPYTKTVSTTAVTGIANFVTGTDYKSVYALSLTNDAVVTGIVSFTNNSSEPVSAVTTYAYYVGQGDFDGTANAYAQKFYINGEVKEYFTTDAVTVVTAGNAGTNKLEVGKVYALTIDTTGKVSAATYKAFNGSGEVTVVDNTFAVIGGSTLYFSANCKVFNVSTGHVGEADTLSTKVTASGSGDVVSYVTVTVSGATYVDVIYITTEAN